MGLFASIVDKVSASALIPQCAVRAALSIANPRSPHWPAVRAAHLRAHPCCAACGGTEDLQVHHIAPFHLHAHLELDPKNLITLCEKTGHWCHFRIGHVYDWRSWNCFVVEDAADSLATLKHRRR
jgi:5-methylcytosine-specific restriction endonuclease McrA